MILCAMREKYMAENFMLQEIMWRYTGFTEHFMDFLRWEIKFLHVQESFKYINQFLNKSYEKILQ